MWGGGFRPKSQRSDCWPLPSKTSTLSNSPTQPPVCPVGEEMSLKLLSTPGDPSAPFILLFCYMLAAIPLEGSPAKPNPRLRLQSESQSCLIVLGRTLAKSSPEEDQPRRWRMQELSAGKVAFFNCSKYLARSRRLGQTSELY